MNSKERVRLALSHQEPDHVPFDLGGTGLTSIHITAYGNLRRYLQSPDADVRVAYVAEQLAAVDRDLADRLQADVWPVRPGQPSGAEPVFRDQGDYEGYIDEWGIGWRKPKQDGLYYDMYLHPLAGVDSLADFRSLRFPDPIDAERTAPLRTQAEAAASMERASVLAGPCAGIVEIYSWLRGYEQFYIDLAVNQRLVAYMLDRLVEYKCAFWERALREVGDTVDAVVEADDLAGQNSLLISPEVYRSLIAPRHRQLFGCIKTQAPVKLFYHSCGAVRPLLADFVDAGIDILNPVQVSAAGMDLHELKRGYGRDLVFWGGGADTQRVLGTGTPDEIRQDVRRNIETLSPGGGFVFAAVHDIQANVPPGNIMAMWEAWQEFGAY